MHITLFINNVNPDAGFHYSTRWGQTITFIYNRDTQRHEYTLPIEEWRADNFNIARSLLEQHLPVPILFDIADISPCVVNQEPAGDPGDGENAQIPQAQAPGEDSFSPVPPPHADGAPIDITDPRAKEPKVSRRRRAESPEQPPPPFIPE